MGIANEDAYFSAYENSVKKTKLGIPGLKMNAPVFTGAGPSGQIGLELEIEAAPGFVLPRDGAIENVRSPDTRANWLSVTDGSLRGEAREYILSTPVNKNEVRGMVEGLYTRFKEQGVSLNLSNRCSTHVHLNASSWRINNVVSFLAMWAMFEKAFIRYCGEERTTNHFALSFKDSPQVLTAVNRLLKFGDFWDARGNSPIKYSALNVMPLNKRGSIEIRCGRADPEPEYAIRWATLLASCADFSKTQYHNPAEIGFALSERGAIDILEQVCATIPGFGSDLFNDLLAGDSSQKFNEDAVEGFRRAQSLIYGHPWDIWSVEIKKEFVPNPFEEGGKKTKSPPLFIGDPVPEEDIRPEVPQILRRAVREAEALAGIARLAVNDIDDFNDRL